MTKTHTYTPHPAMTAGCYLIHTLNPQERMLWTYCGQRASDTQERPDLPGVTIIKCQRCEQGEKAARDENS